MSKISNYYKVYLIDYSENSIEDCSTIEQNYAMCKETPNGLKEIITGKMVYPVAEKPIHALTFGYIPDTLPLYHGLTIRYSEDSYGQGMMIEINPKAVEVWLNKNDKIFFKTYIDNIKRLEKNAKEISNKQHKKK